MASWDISTKQHNDGLFIKDELVVLLDAHLVQDIKSESWDSESALVKIPTISLSQTAPEKELAESCNKSLLLALDLDPFHAHTQLTSKKVKQTKISLAHQMVHSG